MTLRERLTEIFPDILPKNPEEAIWGPDLLKILQARGFQDPEGSLRVTFSTMASDPLSNIAKSSIGHGYYLRIPEAELQPEAIATQTAQVMSDEAGRARQKEEKFRSLYLHWAEQQGHFPMHLEHTRAQRQSAGIHKWKYPDVLSLEWNVPFEAEQDTFNSNSLDVMQHTGDQPLRIFSTELKVLVNSSTVREVFFQCVSNSRWAHVAQLVIATEVQNEQVKEELKRLGTSYDVTVISFGLSLEDLDHLPDANTEISFENIKAHLNKIKTQTIATGQPRDSLDWNFINDLQNIHPDIKSFLSWIAKCLKDRTPYPFKKWNEVLNPNARRALLR